VLRSVSGVALGVALLVIVNASAVDSYEGRQVMAKRPAGSFYSDETGKMRPEAKIGGAIVSVVEENGGWLKVNYGRQHTWVLTQDVVLVDDAVLYFTRRIRAAPMDAWNRAQRGLAQQLAGNWDAALIDCTEAIDLQPKEAASFVNRARIFSALHRQDEAIADYSQAIHLDRTLATAYEGRGTSYAAKKESNRALADLTEAIRLDPIAVEGYLHRGLIYAAQKDHTHAVEDFTQAIHLVPSASNAYWNRALTLEAQQDYDHALADLSMVLRYEPRNASAYFHCGTIFLSKKDYPHAIFNFQQTLGLQPKHVDALDRFAWILATCPKPELRNGRIAVRAAMDACQQSAWKEPNHLSTLAAACAEAGDFPQAIKWQQKVLEVAGQGDEDTLRNARLRLALYLESRPFRSE
jgi:tetratricopeptide (TPR) repeat protein